MTNHDKFAISTPEEEEAFGAIIANRMIDTTPSQVEQLTTGKPKAIGRFVVEYDGAEMEKFGSYVVSATCKEILAAVESGITCDELKEALRSSIDSNSDNAGIKS